MCYGNGCLKEDHMGECSVCDYAPYRKTKFGRPCVLYGACDSVIQYYITNEEFDRAFEFDEVTKLESVAFERWSNDIERVRTIKEIEEKYPWYER